MAKTRIPRSRKLSMGLINITLHPHNAQKYVELFEMVFRRHKIADTRMNHQMILGRLSSITADAPIEGLAGEFYRFFDLDKKTSWLDLSDRQALRGVDRERVRPIPEGLKPDAASFPFIFYPKKHKLVFAMKGMFFENSLIRKRTQPTMSAQALAAVLAQFFDDAKIRSTFGKAEVTPQASADSLEKIWSLDRLRWLTIEVTRPNPDDFEELERSVLENLDEQNADRMTVTIHAIPGQSIKPDKQNKQLAKVAVANGRVVAEGLDSGGKRKKISTDDHPEVSVIEYNPRLMQPVQALATHAADFVRDSALPPSRS